MLFVTLFFFFGGLLLLMNALHGKESIIETAQRLVNGKTA